MSGQHIQASAIFQYDIISFTLHNRECSQAVCAGDGCSCTGNQCTARVLGDIRRFTAGIHLQLSFLVDGGMRGSSSFLNHLPAITVYQRLCCRATVVYILVTPLQSGVMCLSVYRLVTTGVNEGVPCHPRRPDNLPAIFIDGGGFSRPSDHLTAGHIFRLRTTFCTGVDDGSGCQSAMFYGLVTILVNNCTGSFPSPVYPLLTSVIQRGVHRQSVKALPSAITNNRITGSSSCLHNLTTICGDSGVSACATRFYPLPAGVFVTVRPQLKPGTDSHAISCSGYKLVVMVYQCSAIHCFTRVHNDVSSQHRE
ncbi:Uncharacterised protein [Shigella flexneri]|nr:Uncharacterised protein [Shigella flexneri]